VLPVALVVLTAAYIGLTYATETGTRIPFIGVLGGAGATPSVCHCVTDRIISLETSAGDRDKMLVHGFQLFGQNPILGTGPGSFAASVPDSIHPGTFYQYPHNVLLEAAAETGLIGFVLLFAPLVAGWALLFWHGVRRASAPIVTVLAITAVFFVVANVSGDIPSARGLWIFGAVAFKLGIDYTRQRKALRALARAA
jgi:O-antigen ligase